MPQPGTYQCQPITKEEFCEILRNSDDYKSSIGYEQTARYIEKISGCKIPVSRDATSLNSADTMLVCKLKYRVANPSSKGSVVDVDDFEFYLVKFSSL